MKKFVLTELTMDELKSDFREIIKDEVELLSQRFSSKNESSFYLTRKQAAAFLGVSLPTIHSWMKSGKLKGYRIGSRIRFKKDELEGSLKEIRYK